MMQHGLKSNARSVQVPMQKESARGEDSTVKAWWLLLRNKHWLGDLQSTKMAKQKVETIILNSAWYPDDVNYKVSSPSVQEHYTRTTNSKCV